MLASYYVLLAIDILKYKKKTSLRFSSLSLDGCAGSFHKKFKQKEDFRMEKSSERLPANHSLLKS